MKRSPMPRGRRAKPRRSSAVVDHAFREFARAMGCQARHLGRCRGPVEFHHAGSRGLGQKCSDYEGHGICDGHHDLWHDGGPDRPAEWATHDGRMAFAAIAIAKTQEAWTASGGRFISPAVF